MVNHNAKLDAGELSTLWTTYMSNTMVICGLKYFLAIAEDHGIRELLNYALNNSQQQVTTIKGIFNSEAFPIPKGFNDNDVDTQAPRLFSDNMILLYILNMGRLEQIAQSMFLTLVAKDNVANFHSVCLNQSKELMDRGRKLALAKGLYPRNPNIPIPDEVKFVKKEGFITDWLGDKRPLLGVEIANLVYNAERNALGEALCTGFSQVTKTEKIRKYFLRGRDISAKHTETFSSVLNKEFLSSVINMTSEVTDSTTPPFSEKLMMYHVAGLVASGVGQYGVSMSVSPRPDLGIMYTRLSAETSKFGLDGAKMTVGYGWMEQPPMAVDRDHLSKQKD